MTSFLEDGSWRTLPDNERRHVRDKLAETCVKLGIPLNNTISGPLQLSMQLDPRQTTRPPIQLIDDNLTWLHNTPDAKLMVFAPPRAGKSNLCSRWFPFYGLTRRPTDRYIITSYASNLAQGHAAAIRDMVIEHGAPYGLQLRPDESTRADWTLTSGGGVRARGVRSGLTGNAMNCLSAETSIITPSGTREIGEIVASGDHPEVLSLNHSTGVAEWRRVIATLATPRRSVVEIRTTAGRTIRCTADHRIHTDNGYLAAGALQPGDRITSISTPDMRTLQDGVPAEAVRHSESNRKRQYWPELLQSEMLLRDEKRTRHHHLPRLPAGIQTPEVRVGQEDQTRVRSEVLLASMPGQTLPHSVRETLQRMQDADGGRHKPVVLHTAMPSRRTPPQQEGHQATRVEHLPRMQAPIPPEVITDGVLHTHMRERCTLESHDRHGQLAVHGRHQLRRLVPQDAPTHHGTRRAPLRGLPNSAAANPLHAERTPDEPNQPGSASHQPQATGQRTRQPHHPVRAMPPTAPSPTNDTVSMVREIREEPITVYDLQVEGNHNFFAGEILVHNCGIIDDPYRDRQEADSPLIRERVWEWYSSAFVSRQAPGARQIITLTRWHVDDIAGRLLEREGRIEDGGEWKVVHLPAIALTPDPERGIYPDPLGRPPGELLQHPLIDVDDIAELANYWTKRKNSSTQRDWSALYQGTPFDATGGLLTEQMIRDRTGTPGAPRRAGVGVDPSGGGRDTAGIVGGHVDVNGKFWFTHDRTAKMPADRWAKEACVLADEIDADRIVYESNYGGDQAGTLITQAWAALQAEGLIPQSSLCPRVVGVQSRKSKFLRAEPIAQAVITDRAGFSAEQPLRTLKGEWQMWETGSTWSPGALDAGVHLAYELLPAVGAGLTVHSVAARKRDSATATGVAARRISR